MKKLIFTLIISALIAPVFANDTKKTIPAADNVEIAPVNIQYGTYQIINADTDQPVATFTQADLVNNTYTFDLDIAKNINLVANPTSAITAPYNKVEFITIENTRTEGVPPFAYYGDFNSKYGEAQGQNPFYGWSPTANTSLDFTINYINTVDNSTAATDTFTISFIKSTPETVLPLPSGLELHTQSNAGSMVVNESNGTQGWSTTGGTTILESDSNESYTGNHSIKVQSNTNASYPKGIYTFSTQVGKEYAIRIYAKSSSVNKPGFYYWQGFSNFNGTGINSTDWKAYTFNLTANATTAEIRLYLGNPSELGSTVYIDNISIIEVGTDYIKRINCGDTAAATYDGETYMADDPQAGGYTYIGDELTTVGHTNFSLDTNPGEIFRQTRYTKLPSMKYIFPVADGNYTVKMFFAEPFHGPNLSGNPVDYRQFDININSTTVQDNFCVYCEAGDANIVITKEYNVAVSQGNGLTLEFAQIANANDPIVQSIEIKSSEPPINVSSVSLNNATLSMETGDTDQLVATISPGNASNQNVTWSSSAPTIANVDQSGLITAIAAGTATITVTTTDGGFTAQSIVTVTDPVINVTSVSLNKTTQSIETSNTDQLIATISPGNATNQNVTWSSNDSAVADVDSSGLVTANAAGTATITATTVDGNFTAESVVTVTDPTGPTINVTSVSLDKTTLSLETNGTEQLTATILPSNATNQSITWSSNDSAVADVDSSGLVTAYGAGTATITVTTTDGGFTAESVVTVTDSTNPPTGLWVRDANSNALTTDTQVGIGTTVIPNTYQLAVNGKIIATELKVQLQSNWPDYVFAKDYRLPTLKEVEKHIQEKGHLIHMPSAQKVKQEGVELGEMNKLLLEKIEELTLYTLQQQKEIDELKKLLLKNK